MDPLPLESILKANPTMSDLVEKTIIFKPLALPFTDRATVELPYLTRNAFWTHLYIKLIDFDQVNQGGNVLVGAHSALGLFPPIYFTNRQFTNGWVPLPYPSPTRALHHRTLKVEVQTPETFEGILLVRALAVEDLFVDRLDDHLFVDELGDVQSQITYGPEGGHLYDRRNQQELLREVPGRRIHYSGVL